MKAWDIYSFQPPDWPEPHPAVIVSHPDRVTNKPEVNVVMCTSHKANRPPKANEVILDQNDGLGHGRDKNGIYRRCQPGCLGNERFR